jgi:hypothetical protein
VLALAQLLQVPHRGRYPPGRGSRRSRRIHHPAEEGDHLLEIIRQRSERQEAEFLCTEEGARRVSAPTVEGLAPDPEIGLRPAQLVAQQLTRVRPDEVLVGHDAQRERKHVPQLLPML